MARTLPSKYDGRNEGYVTSVKDQGQSGLRLVLETPQCLPVYRLQASGGRRHGRGQVLRGEKSAADLEYKIPSDGRVWGTRHPRPSALGKVTGTLDYGADLGLKLPENALMCALVQAEVSHAKILSIDTSEAEKMPGVYKVVTHKDVKGKNRITGLITFPTNKGDGWDRPILCDEKIFQYGDAIAIVCADTEKNAKTAAKKVKVEIEQLPEYMSAPAAMAEDAIEIHPGTPNVYYIQKVAKGEETAPIFDQVDVVVEGSYYTHLNKTDMKRCRL